MPNRQKYRPISFRPPESDRLWLADYARQTGRPVNSILAQALAEYRERADARQCTHAYPDVRNIAGVRVCRACG